MNLKIILISAKARHGKDSTANLFKKKVESRGKSAIIVHYADILKYWCAEYFGGNYERTPKNRTLWQKYGTDIARKRNPNIWVKLIMEFIKTFGKDYDYILIPDTRFSNECDIPKKIFKNVCAVRVKRTNFISDLTEEQQNHESEVSLDEYKFDYYIEAENLEELSKETDKLIEWIDNLKTSYAVGGLVDNSIRFVEDNV
jgi:hypothetical protein